MIVMSFETVLRRDRTIVAVALATIALLSWIYILMLIWQMDHGMSSASAGPASGMSMAGMDMGNMDMQHMAMTGMTALETPGFADLPVLLLMWSVMMIGMMTPSAAPMILLYARVARQAAAKGQPLAATSWFAGGYLLAWIGFSILASVAQIWLQRQALLTPTMDSSNRLFSAFLMLAAGLFQWGPLKDACLTECRMPLRFIQRHGGFRREASQSLRLGFVHGSYCVGCCWALMALLFVGGVMNMLWIAGLSILVLLEKMMPLGRSIARVIGVALFLGGGWMLISELV
jgi:predicted metal-binding membrane protein